MTKRMQGWVGAFVLGGWLSLAAVWPVFKFQAGNAPILCQPLLLLSLLALTVVRARRVGWAAAAGSSFFLYIVVTLAGWLPWLRTIPSTPDFHYPPVYQYYLALYEAGLAALVGLLAGHIALGRAATWWPAGVWSRSLVIAPLLLMARALWFGHWLSPLIGLVIGLGLAASWPRRTGGKAISRVGWKLVPFGLIVFAILLVWVSGMWIYLQLGPDFHLNSDDGTAFFQASNEIAVDLRRIWSPPPVEANMFTGYFVLMGLWFRLVGPHIPSWFVWQGLAAGLLAVIVYWMGRRLCNRSVGLVAAGLVLLDHTMLHLMATLNMEVCFIPALYMALYLWASVDTQHPERLRRCFLAGLALGLATTFRPTALLLMFGLLALLVFERPKLSFRQISAHGLRLVGGFMLPLALLLTRHRSAWGEWTLGGARAAPLSWEYNYAWLIQDQHPRRIGFGPWLELLAEDPTVIWRDMIPDWWTQMLYLWTHRGFGQMDLIQGLNYPGLYQGALVVIFAAAVAVGVAKALTRRSRADLMLLLLPVYFTSLTFVFWVINTRYRAPFLPVLYLLCCTGMSATAAAVRARIAALDRR